MTSSEERTARSRTLLERVFELTARLSDGMGEEFERQGLTSARAELLWRLHAAGPQTQRALSDALRCTPRNVTGLVDALEAAGLVWRAPHPTDRRATLVTLTEEGDSTVAGWRSRYDQFAQRLFGELGADDLARFEIMLDHVLERIRHDLPADSSSVPGRERHA